MVDPTDETGDEGNAPTAEDFRELRRNANHATKLARENAELTERLAEMERQVAFSSAGLNLSDKQRTALLAIHDGDLTADALRATAVELGFADSPEADEQSRVRDAALAAQARISAAATGARPPVPVPKLEERIVNAQAEKNPQLVARLKAQAALQTLRAGQPVRVE